MRVIYKDEVPDCDVCGKSNLSHVYNMPFDGGHWATVCEACRQSATNPEHPAGVKIIREKNPKATVGYDPADGSSLLILLGLI
jgi:hypothetical protein